MSDKQIVVKFLGDTKGFDEATKKVTGGADKIGVSFKDLSVGGFAAGLGAKAAAGALGLVSSAADIAIDFINGSIEASSNLRESMSLSKQVFETNAGAIEKWGDTASDTMGTSKQDALDMASGFGTAFKNIGLSLDETTDKSKELSERAVDLGSAFNTSSEEAAEALRSGLLGESEPMRKFGVFLDEAKTKAWLLAKGFKPVNGAFTDAEKVTARYNIILEQTADSAGMFGRDAESLADKQKSVNAQMEDAQAKLGDKLLPIMVRLADFTSDVLVPALGGAIDALDLVGGAIDFMLGPMGSMGKTEGPALALTIENNTSAALVGAAAWSQYAIDVQYAADEVRGFTGESFDSAAAWDTNSERIAGSLKAVNTESGDLKTDVVDDNRKIEKSYKDISTFLLGQFQTDFDAGMDIVDARADLSALNAEEDSLRKIIASKNSTREEKADANQRLAELPGERSQAYSTIEKYNGMSEKDYDDWATNVSADYNRAKGVEKTYFGSALGHIYDLRDAAKHNIVQNVLYDTEYRTTYTSSGQAPKPRAKGGPASGLTWVGEEGPELLNLPAGSYVHSNPDSMRMVTQSAVSGHGRSGPGNVTININGAQDVSNIMLQLRRELTRQGMSFA